MAKLIHQSVIKFLFIFFLFHLNPLAQDTVRVMTFNIHHAEGIDGEINLKRIANVIRENNIHLAALQEVDRGVERSFKIDIADSLSKLTGMDYTFGKNIIYQGGDYGNAMLSAFPIVTGKNTHYKMIREGEQRGLLQSIIEVNGKRIAVLNTHIDYREDDTERLSNVNEIFEMINEFEIPLIICGDFNDTPESETINKMKEKFEDAWEAAGKGEGLTYPAHEPVKRIDYIFFKEDSGKTLKLNSITVINSDASDHLPVIAEFIIR